jgi:hypothetical protein
LAEFVPHYSIICLPKKQWCFLLELKIIKNRFVPGAEEYIMEALEWLELRQMKLL